MRRLIGVLVVLALIAVGLAALDIWARHRVQSLAAAHIEAEVPGSSATVTISSFPFLGRIAASGTVPKLTVDATGVTEAGLTFSDIDVVVKNLKVNRSQLTNRKVVLQSIGSGSVTATLTQASLDHETGLPITLGSGTVGLAGVVARPAVSVSGATVTLSVAPLPALRITVPVLSLLPCVGGAVIVPGALQLSCRITALPTALANFSARF